MENLLKDDPETLDKLIGLAATMLTDESMKPLMTTERKLAVLDAMDIKVLEYTDTRIVVKVMPITVILDKSDDGNISMSMSFDMNALGALV